VLPALKQRLREHETLFGRLEHVGERARLAPIRLPRSPARGPHVRATDAALTALVTCFDRGTAPFLRVPPWLPTSLPPRSRSGG
jgi:hypothetical protein